MAQAVRFQTIYREGEWRSHRVLSGDGSRLENTLELRSWLEEQAGGGLRSVLDLGCGDLTWVSEIPAIVERRLDYHGVDVVPALIAHHKRVFPWFNGEACDLEEYVRISADIVILKDVLQHHCNGTAGMVLDNVARGSWRRLLVTSNPGARNDRRGGIRGPDWRDYDVENARRNSGERVLPGAPALRIHRPGGGEYQIWER